jgi:hypothetical protein
LDGAAALTAAQQLVQQLIKISRSGSGGACKMNLTLLSLHFHSSHSLSFIWVMPCSQRCAMLCHAVLRPQGSSETAAESLLTLDDAAALTAAEQMVQQLVNLARSSSDNGNGNSSGDGDAAAAAAAKEKGGSEAAAGSAMEVDVPPQQQQQQQEPAVGSKEHQLLLGRRLLQVRHTGCLSLCEISLAT